MEATYYLSRVKVNLSKFQLLDLRATFHKLPPFYLRTQFLRVRK